MALYIPHSIFHLARLLYVRPETSGSYYVCKRLVVEIFSFVTMCWDIFVVTDVLVRWHWSLKILPLRSIWEARMSVGILVSTFLIKCLIKVKPPVQAIKIYMEVWLHSVLSMISGRSDWLSLSGRFTPEEINYVGPWIRGWAGFITCLYVLEKRNMCCIFRETKYGSSSP